MSEPELYIAYVTVRVEMAVVADSVAEAKREAYAHYKKELDDASVVDCFVEDPCGKVPKSLKGSLPYGPRDDEPGREWTCEQWLAKDSDKKADGMVSSAGVSRDGQSPTFSPPVSGGSLTQDQEGA